MVWMRQKAWWNKATGPGGKAETAESGDNSGLPLSRPLDYQKLENALRHLRWARMMLHEMSGAHNGEKLGWELYDMAQRVNGDEREVDALLKKFRSDGIPGA